MMPISVNDGFAEEALLFSCENETLVGVLARPKAPANRGVVVIVGGPQYRAGSHRQFVALARALAAAGFAVLRFDYRGMGDSSGERRDFEAVSDDIGAAIDALQQAVPSVRRVALWGLCDAASAALLYCGETGDKRVDRLALLNPWVRSEATLARTHVKHYYRQRLMQRDFWAKLASGRVALGALAGLVQNVKAAAAGGRQTSAKLPFQARMASAWNQFDGNLLLVLSAEDYTAKEFVEHASVDPQWRLALGCERLTRQEIPGADHTLSDAMHAQVVEQWTRDWLSAGERSGGQILP